MSNRNSPARAGSKPERAFLIGVDFHSHSGGRDEVPGGEATDSRKPQALTSGARAARNASLSGAESARSSRVPQFSAEESLSELRELATSAGAEIVGEFLQHRDRPDAATLIGRGKLDEIAGAASSASADLIIFDHELSPSQQRNIEREVSARVIDRTQLILDIFARHARTREGQLQVELAQLKYLMPRLAGRGKEMSQLGGGIGTRGPGETQLETDRRKIYRRVRHLEQQLENVRRIRAQQRQRRESVPVPTVALVGYTNAGKSTTFNALTKAGVLESGKMFATLDPTIRAIVLPSKRKVLLSDTVGFIRNLPHTLVSAFRATLEEVQRGALILHISDATSHLAAEQDAQVEQVLRELEAADKPRVMVMNKVDALPPLHRESLRDDDKTIHISAKTGFGLSALLERIDEMLLDDPIARVQLRVPQSEGKVLAHLEASARIYSRQYHDGLVYMDVKAPESFLRRVRQFALDEPLNANPVPANAKQRQRRHD
ncbi:MAG TPA: GTPase HflX [Terriglobales bacterium]|nr:GTPase HflX [Terriglobales bacterium]